MPSQASSPAPRIRGLGLGDSEAIADLLVRCQAARLIAAGISIHADFNQLLADTRALLAVPGAFAIGAEAGALVGYCACVPDPSTPATAQLKMLFVDPAWWGSGLALRLQEAALACLRARGCDQVWLVTQRANARARAFYERHGWHGGQAIPQTDKPWPEVRYERRLSP